MLLFSLFYNYIQNLPWLTKKKKKFFTSLETKLSPKHIFWIEIFLVCHLSCGPSVRCLTSCGVTHWFCSPIAIRRWRISAFFLITSLAKCWNQPGRDILTALLIFCWVIAWSGMLLCKLNAQRLFILNFFFFT